MKYLSAWFMHNNEDSGCSLQHLQKKTLFSVQMKYVFLVKNVIVAKYHNFWPQPSSHKRRQSFKYSVFR